MLLFTPVCPIFVIRFTLSGPIGRSELVLGVVSIFSWSIDDTFLIVHRMLRSERIERFQDVRGKTLHIKRIADPAFSRISGDIFVRRYSSTTFGFVDDFRRFFPYL